MHKFVSAFAAASLFATPALAGERTATVRHADLDTKSAAGRAELDRRIAAATEEVCGSYAATTPEEQREIKRCRAGVARQIAARTGGAQVARR